MILPEFCQWIEKSIEEGMVGTEIFSKFRRTRSSKGSALPCFLHGLTSLVFDSKSGLLKETADVNAVLFIRQICLAFKKVKAKCTPKRERLALLYNVEVDSSLKQSDRRMFFSVVDRICIDTVISRMLAYYKDEGKLPRHGKGATVERFRSNEKYMSRGYLRRWDQVIGWEELYGMNTIDQFDSDLVIEPKDEKPVRVITVPKTLKSPRIIAVEPVAMQYAQQLVARRLMDSVGKSPFGRYVNFYSQVANRDAALSSSKTREMATLDLSEASDRVSCKLVREIFRTRKDVLKELFSVRSGRAGYPHGSVVNLRRYASMGSATTFPVEAIVFYALVVSACAQAHFGDMSLRNRRISCYSTGRSGVDQRPNGHGFKVKETSSLLASLRLVADRVLVFGDDIVVPAHFCQAVIDYLELYGLKVNLKKTFHKGPFRESCGMDAFKGYNITPTYVRHDPFDDSKSPEWFAATVALSNQLFLKGMWKTADYVSGLLPKLPLVAMTSPGLGFWHYTGAYTPQRYSVRNNEWQVYTWCISARRQSDKIDGTDALLKHFITAKEQDGVQLGLFPEPLTTAPDHLDHSTKRYSSKLSKKWVTPY
jgi:hypothetical protein